MSQLIVRGGENAERWIGENIRGLRTNLALIQNPEVPVPGTGYSLFTQRELAFDFIDANAVEVQARLKERGVETELVILPGRW
ncbi:MAG: hypothetical protein ABSB50_12610 [Terracidiphilus sp.]|jgi:hypothetical protein